MTFNRTAIARGEWMMITDLVNSEKNARSLSADSNVPNLLTHGRKTIRVIDFVTFLGD